MADLFRLSMQKPNEPAYNRPGVYLIDASHSDFQMRRAAKFDSSQAHDMDTVEPPRGRIFVVRTLS